MCKITYAISFFWKNVRSFCTAKATQSFLAKNHVFAYIVWVCKVWLTNNVTSFEKTTSDLKFWQKCPGNQLQSDQGLHCLQFARKKLGGGNILCLGFVRNSLLNILEQLLYILVLVLSPLSMKHCDRDHASPKFLGDVTSPSRRFRAMFLQTGRH